MTANIRHHPDRSGRTQRWLASTLRGVLRSAMKPMFHPRIPVALLRTGMQALASTTLRAPGARFQPVCLGGVDGELVTAARENGQAVLYFHGGAYCVGSPATHRTITSYLAHQASCAVFAVDYRLAPEHPHPAAVDDALTAYRWLLENGYRHDQIHLAGDSAGGGLALVTALQIRDLGLPPPASLVLISPWLDLTLSRREQPVPTGEAMLSWDTLEHSARRYAGNNRHDPRVSPLFAELAHLPPTLVVVGTDEILLGDAEALHQRLAATGARHCLSVYENRWHVFPAHAGLLTSANDAIREMATWMAASDA